MRRRSPRRILIPRPCTQKYGMRIPSPRPPRCLLPGRCCLNRRTPPPLLQLLAIVSAIKAINFGSFLLNAELRTQAKSMYLLSPSRHLSIASDRATDLSIHGFLQPRVVGKLQPNRRRDLEGRILSRSGSALHTTPEPELREA